MRNRHVTLHTFASGSTDVTVTIPLPEGGGAGKFSVWSRRVSGSGTATLAIDGTFKATPASDDRFVVQTANTVGTGVLTSVTTNKDALFSQLTIVLDRTGTCAVDVFIAAY